MLQHPVVKHPFLSSGVWRGFLHIWGARCDWEGSVGEGLGSCGKVFPEKHWRSRQQRRGFASTGFWPLHEGRNSLTQRRLHCYGGKAWLILADKSWWSGSRLFPVWGEAGETPRRTWRTRGQPRLLCRPLLDQQTHNVSKVISWSTELNINLRMAYWISKHSVVAMTRIFGKIQCSLIFPYFTFTYPR